MPTITLLGGDFGTEVSVTVGQETLYMPDRVHPGLPDAVALADIEVMDSREDAAAAPRLGVLPVARSRMVVFAAVLKDGRTFTAEADKKTWADLRSAHVAARAAAFRADAPGPADEIIARHVAARDRGRVPRSAAVKAPPPSKPETAPVPPPPSPHVFGRRPHGG